MQDQTRRLSSAFIEKVEFTSSCWLWVGATQSKGYGSYGVDGRTHLAHRWAYEAIVGPIPPDLTIDHLCSVKRCVNPDHLEVVTRGENIRRYARLKASTASYPCGHPRTEGNTLAKSRGGRECRACNRERLVRSRRELVSA